MKLIFTLILTWQVSALAAETTKTQDAEKPARKVAQQQNGVCAKQAGKVALGIVKGLGQDVAVEQVVLLQTQKNLEIYNVKLKSKDGSSSDATNKYWMIQLWDLGSGCGFKSVSLEDAAG